MTSTNPVSPKVYAIPAGAAIGAVLLVLADVIVTLFSDGSLVSGVPEPWKSIIVAVVPLIGALAAAWRTKDGLRLPTLSPDAVSKLANSEQQKQQAISVIADASNPPIL